MNKDIVDKVKQADMVLVGIGEEFEDEGFLRKQPGYVKMRDFLSEDRDWLIPALNRSMLCKTDNKVKDALKNLGSLLRDKNYFIVYIPTNDIIWECGFDNNRVTAPCGGSLYRQCSDGCANSLKLLSREEADSLQKCASSGIWEEFNLGICEECGRPLILNNVYARKYNEEGYLGQWRRYTGWLQGTLNRKLMILELGVGMQCPTVVRWPFEKTAYFNQKSYMVRVHEHLFQLSEEIKDRACSVPCNAIEWLLQ